MMTPSFRTHSYPLLPDPDPIRILDELERREISKPGFDRSLHSVREGLDRRP
jgi:hypothetical protein